MLAKTLLKAPPKATNVIPVAGGASATAKDLEHLVRSVCTTDGDWAKASALITGAHHLNMVPTWRTYKELLSCMARSHTGWSSSLAIIDQISAGQMSTHALYRTYVSLCAAAGDGESTQHVLAEASRKGVGMVPGIYLAVARCYLACEMFDALMGLPALMVKDRVPVTNDLLSVLLEGCAHCEGMMGEHAKMILLRAGTAKAATCSVARHYLLSLPGEDWELGTREFLQMPYEVRQDGDTMAALARLMARGGQWDAAWELVTRQLWDVKQFNNTTIDAMLDDRTEQLVARHRNSTAGGGTYAWAAASKEAVELFYKRRGYTRRSGDVVLRTFFGASTASATSSMRMNSPSEEQIIAATNFIAKAKEAVPTITFSPSAAGPLLASLPWEAAHQLLCDQEETLAAGGDALPASPSPPAPLSAEDEAAYVRFMGRPDVPLEVVAALVERIPSALGNGAILRRLAGSPPTGGSGHGAPAAPSAVLVQRMGPHAAAAALYNEGLWEEALAVLRAHVKGPDELTETIIANQRLWKEALAYAESCEAVREETLRGFAVPVCSVCGQWAEVERVLDRIGTTSDVEDLLLREARRRIREDDIRRLLRVGRVVEAAKLWTAFYEGEPMLSLEKALGDTIVMGLLNSSMAMGADGEEERAAVLRTALAVAKTGAAPKDSTRPCSALLAAASAGNAPLPREEGHHHSYAADNAVAARLIVGTTTQCSAAEEGLVERAVAVAERYDRTSSSPSSDVSLVPTAAFVHSLFAASRQGAILLGGRFPLSFKMLKALGGSSAAVDEALQRVAAAYAASSSSSSSSPSGNTASWGAVLGVYQHCTSVALAPLGQLVRLAVDSASAVDTVTIMADLVPVVEKALGAIQQRRAAANGPSTRGAAAAVDAAEAELVTAAASLFVHLRLYGKALAVYSEHADILLDGEAQMAQFLLVCSKASGQGEEALRAVARSSDASARIRSLLKAGQWQLAARLYRTEGWRLQSSDGAKREVTLLSHQPSPPVGRPHQAIAPSDNGNKATVLREVLTAMLPHDPVAASLLAQQEASVDAVGMDCVQGILKALTAGTAHPSVGAAGLLHAARLMEWLADHDAKLVTDSRMALLLNACVPMTAPPRGHASGGAAAVDHGPMLAQTAAVLRRIADKTSQGRIVGSILSWVRMGGPDDDDADLLDPLLALGRGDGHRTGHDGSALVGRILGDRPSLEGPGDAATSASAAGAPVWTEERKAMAAKFYPYLMERVGESPSGEGESSPSGNKRGPAGADGGDLDPFTYVAAKGFSGEVSAADVRALWFRSNGGSRRHLGRLFAQQTALATHKRAAAAGASSISSSGAESKVRSAAPSSVAVGAVQLMAANMAVIRFGTEGQLQALCSEHFKEHTPSSLRAFAFRSGAALRACVREHPRLVKEAHHSLPSPLSQQLIARLSDYGRSDLFSPSLWRAVAMHVFQGSVTAVGVGHLLSRHLPSIRTAARQRWSREAERELSACLDRTGAPPTYLEADPSRSRKDIQRYVKQFHWVIRQRGSFNGGELEAVAEVSAYAGGGHTRDGADADPLGVCMTTHTAQEVERLLSPELSSSGRLADLWHSTIPLTSFALGDASLLVVDGNIVDGIRRDTPLVVREGSDGSLMPSPSSRPVHSAAASAHDASSSDKAPLAVAKRLAEHQRRDKGYITYATAKAVLGAAEGDSALCAAAAWLSSQGFTIGEEAARKMLATGQPTAASGPSSSSPASAVTAVDRATSVAWLRGINHFPLLYGACKVLVTASSATASAAVPQAAAVIKAELTRLAKGRTSRAGAREAWSLMLRYGVDKHLSTSDRLDIAIALAGAGK